MIPLSVIDSEIERAEQLLAKHPSQEQLQLYYMQLLMEKNRLINLISRVEAEINAFESRFKGVPSYVSMFPSKVEPLKEMSHEPKVYVVRTSIEEVRKELNESGTGTEEGGSEVKAVSPTASISKEELQKALEGVAKKSGQAASQGGGLVLTGYKRPRIVISGGVVPHMPGVILPGHGSVHLQGINATRSRREAEEVEL